PEVFPVGEEVAVLDEHVAAGFQVVLLLHLPPLQLLANGEAVLGVDEGYVVHQEDVGFADGGEILRRLHGGGLPVAPSIEAPRAAEGAVPGAASGQLRGGAGIEHADEVLVASPGQVARGQEAVEVVEEGG